MIARWELEVRSRHGLNEQLQFTPDEVQQFKSMGLPPRESMSSASLTPAEIKILGFQSPSNLKIDENIKHSYFIYPDETVRLALAFCSQLADRRSRATPDRQDLSPHFSNHVSSWTDMLSRCVDYEQTPNQSLRCSFLKPRRSPRMEDRMTHRDFT